MAFHRYLSTILLPCLLALGGCSSDSATETARGGTGGSSGTSPNLGGAGTEGGSLGSGGISNSGGLATGGTSSSGGAGTEGGSIGSAGTPSPGGATTTAGTSSGSGGGATAGSTSAPGGASTAGSTSTPGGTSSAAGALSGSGGTATAGSSPVAGAPSCGLGSYQLPTGPSYATKNGTSTLSRVTAWEPGIPGGIPNLTTVCATLSPTGKADDGPINQAISSCPENQVVLLRPGSYAITNAILLNRNHVVLRGSGGPGASTSAQTRLLADASLYGPVVNIGPDLFPKTDGKSVNLTADALQGTSSVNVSDTAGFKVGDLVLVDIVVDPADDTGAWLTNAPAGSTALVYPYAEYNPDGSPKDDDSRGWFNRKNRPISQVLEISAIAGTMLTFSSRFHMTFDLGHSAQVTPITYNGSNTTPVAYAGLENLCVSGVPDPGGATQYNNVVVTQAKYSWVKNVESDQSNGYSVGLDLAFRCVVRDSYLHSTINPTPGGGGYGLEFSAGSADNLVENNISWNFNKVMVMRASGGGNVIAYNYMDDAWIAYQPNWPESGLNDGHMTTPHFELFEGNLSFSMGGDDTWGGAIFDTWHRNVSTGHRSAWPPLNTYTFNGDTQTTGCKSGGANDFTCIPYSDVGPRVPAGVQHGHVFYNFIGNVLGDADMPVAPQAKGFQYENSGPDWNWDPVSMWWVGFGATDVTDQGAVNTLYRDGNYDYATKAVHYAGSAQTLPSSLYLCGKPAFFGSYGWPWVDGSNASRPYLTHSFQYFPLSASLGTYGTTGTMVAYSGFQLPAYVRFLQLHGVEQPAASCSSATLESVPAACGILLTGMAQ
jgi:hypothetical protein